MSEASATRADRRDWRIRSRCHRRLQPRSVGRETRSGSRLAFRIDTVLTVGAKKMRSPDGLRNFASQCEHSARAPSRDRINGGELSRSSLVPLRPFGEPTQFREQAGELGTSADRVHRVYLDSGAGERACGAPARHSLENSCSMSPALSRSHSTAVCSGTMGEQQIQFGTHLPFLRAGNAAEAYVLAAARTRTEVPRARESTAAEAGHVHQ